MNEFKVGDWVRAIDGTDISIIGIDTIRWYEEIEGKDIANEWELWQPKEGEWCWSKYDGLVNILSVTDSRYLVFPLSSSKGCTVEYKLSGLEPFIGELPSFIKG